MSGYQPFPTDDNSNNLVSQIDPRLASRGRRFGAYLIDSLLLTAITFGIVFAVALAIGTDEDTSDDVFAWVFVLVWALLILLYYPLLMMRRGRHNGQTLGKQALNVRVVTREGVPVTFWRAVRRDVLGTTAINIISGGLYWLVDYPVGLFTDRRQTLHDRIAATFVFREEVVVTPVAQQHQQPSPFGSDDPYQAHGGHQPLPAPGEWPQQPPQWPAPSQPAPQQPSQWDAPPPPAPPQPPAPPAPAPDAQQPRPADEPAEQPRKPWTPPRSPDYDRQRDDANRAFGR